MKNVNLKTSEKGQLRLDESTRLFTHGAAAKALIVNGLSHFMVTAKAAAAYSQQLYVFFLLLN